MDKFKEIDRKIWAAVAILLMLPLFYGSLKVAIQHQGPTLSNPGAVQEYNQKHREIGLYDISGGSAYHDVSDPVYTAALDYGDNLMGILAIPSANINLGVYHHTLESTLRSGFGHVYGSALPIKCEGGCLSIIKGTTGVAGSSIPEPQNIQKGAELTFLTGDALRSYEIRDVKILQKNQIKTLEDRTKGTDLLDVVAEYPQPGGDQRLVIESKFVRERLVGDDLMTKLGNQSLWRFILFGLGIIILLVLAYVKYIKPRRKVKMDFKNIEVTSDDLAPKATQTRR